MLKTPLIRRSCVALLGALCVLLNAGSGESQQEQLLWVPLSEHAAGAATEAIRGGELRIVDLQEGRVLRIGDLETTPAGLPVEASRRPEYAGDCFVVSDFEFASRNRLGGRFSSFERAPSSASVDLIRDQDGRRVLRFRYARRDHGFAGLAIGLAPREPEQGTRYYLDASGFSTLSFWVRGGSQGTDPRLRLADASASATELGKLASFLPSGRLEPRWQRAVIPLSELPAKIDRRRLAKLVLEVAGPGDGDIDLDRLALCRGTALPDLPSAPAPAPPNAPSPLALWIWHTSDLIGDRTATDRLAAFVAAQGIQRVYLQLPGRLIGAAAGTALEADVIEPLRALVATLTGAGAEVFGLDGSAEYALAKWHDRVVQAVRNVGRYNRRVSPNGRFSGVHYDVEPYLLPGFADASRQLIITAYVALLERIGTAARDADLWFEAAIPAWFDSVRITSASSDALRFKPLSELVIDRTDSVAIMDYRTRADGSNGTIALAESELAYAHAVGKKVWVGLETTTLPDEEILMFEGEGEPGLPTAGGTNGWIIAAPLAQGWHLAFVPARALALLIESLERSQVELDAIRHWRVTRHTRVPASRLTFANLGADRLHEVMRESEIEMRRQPSFAGFAIHYYRPYAQMLADLSSRSDPR